MQRNIVSERLLGLPREPSFDRDIPFNEVIRNRGNFKTWTRGRRSRRAPRWCVNTGG